MPPLAALVATNSTLRTKLPALVAVIVGATSGIGEAAALKLASLTDKPTLCLVGRSKASADRIIESLNKVNENGIYAFHPCDVSSVADVRRVTADLKSKLPKINFLVMSPGIFTFKGRDETPEGNDKKMMLHYYGRMLFARELAPLLVKGAADSGGSSVQTSKVLSVLDATTGNADKLIMDDLDLKHNYSLKNAATHTCAMSDAAVQHLSTLYPSVTFIHMAPGAVKTNIGNKLPFYARPLLLLALTFASKPEDFAERLVYALAEDDIRGWALLDRFGDRVSGKTEMLSEDIRTKVWEHTETIVGK